MTYEHGTEFVHDDTEELWVIIQTDLDPQERTQNEGRGEYRMRCISDPQGGHIGIGALRRITAKELYEDWTRHD